jgi:hypothetical protein
VPCSAVCFEADNLVVLGITELGMMTGDDDWVGAGDDDRVILRSSGVMPS